MTLCILPPQLFVARRLVALNQNTFPQRVLDTVFWRQLSVNVLSGRK